jgi:hypothetical protein
MEAPSGEARPGAPKDVGPPFGAGPVADPRHPQSVNENDRLRYRAETDYGSPPRRTDRFSLGGMVTTPMSCGVHHIRFSVPHLNAGGTIRLYTDPIGGFDALTLAHAQGCR